MSFIESCEVGVGLSISGILPLHILLEDHDIFYCYLTGEETKSQDGQDG